MSYQRIKDRAKILLPDVIKALRDKAEVNKSNPIRGYIFELEDVIRFQNSYEDAPIAKIFMAHSHEEAIVKIHEYLYTHSDRMVNYLEGELVYFLETDEDNNKDYIIETDRFVEDMIFDPLIMERPRSDTYWIKVLEISE